MARVNGSGKGLLIVAGAAALYFLLRGINFANSVDLIFKKIRFGGSFFYPEAYATFTIINPTDVSVTIDGVIGNVLYNGQPVASVSTDTAVQVGGHQAIDIDLKLISKMADLFSALANTTPVREKNSIVFSGQVMANGIPLPLTKNLA